MPVVGDVESRGLVVEDDVGRVGRGACRDVNRRLEVVGLPRGSEPVAVVAVVWLVDAAWRQIRFGRLDESATSARRRLRIWGQPPTSGKPLVQQEREPARNEARLPR